jgi:hypothetical protein
MLPYSLTPDLLAKCYNLSGGDGVAAYAADDGPLALAFDRLGHDSLQVLDGGEGHSVLGSVHNDGPLVFNIKLDFKRSQVLRRFIRRGKDIEKELGMEKSVFEDLSSITRA